MMIRSGLFQSCIQILVLILSDASITKIHYVSSIESPLPLCSHELKKNITNTKPNKITAIQNISTFQQVVTYPTRGGVVHINQNDINTTPSPTNRKGKMLRVVTLSTVSYALFSYRHIITKHFPSKEKFQSTMLNSIQKINDKGFIGKLYYIILLALWECVGLSTVLIEPTAGMVFGFQKGLVANAIGKVGGAMLAYAIGRTFLSSKIKSKFLLKESKSPFTNRQSNSKSSNIQTNKTLSLNQVFTLLNQSIKHKPFQHALAMRFSIFPQVVKNLALSILDPIVWYLFLIVTSIQVLPFTALWTWLGYDTSLRMSTSSDVTSRPNHVLRGFLLFGTLFGFIGSPSITAWWVNNMIKEKEKYEE